jgi:hypothetical protein
VNLQFLGDALDHWKGSVFEQLQQAGQLVDFMVDAMASDSEEWKPEDWCLFAKLLRVTPAQIIDHKVSLHGIRDNYFRDIPRSGDIFLDTDTGIQTGKVTDPRQYLKPVELAKLLGTDECRLVAVYQHVRAQRTNDRVVKVLDAVRGLRNDFHCLSYESGTVAMLFFSLDRSRVTSLMEFFNKFLGSHAKRRIGLWV